MKIWKNKCLLKIRSAAPSFLEKEKEDEVLRKSFILVLNKCDTKMLTNEVELVQKKNNRDKVMVN